MQISRDNDGVELKMSHAEFSNLHSFIRMGVELAANQVFNGLPDFLADGPVIEDDKIRAPWAAEEETINESEGREVWSGRQHEKHSRRLDWLEGMYRALDKRVKITENEVDLEQNPAWLNLVERVDHLVNRVDEYENRWSQTVTELKTRMDELQNYPRREGYHNPVSGRLTGMDTLGASIGQVMRNASPLAQAEARVRDYMKTNFSAATILGVVDAIRGE